MCDLPSIKKLRVLNLQIIRAKSFLKLIILSPFMKCIRYFSSIFLIVSKNNYCFLVIFFSARSSRCLACWRFFWAFNKRFSRFASFFFSAFSFFSTHRLIASMYSDDESTAFVFFGAFKGTCGMFSILSINESSLASAIIFLICSASMSSDSSPPSLRSEYDPLKYQKH